MMAPKGLHLDISRHESQAGKLWITFSGIGKRKVYLIEHPLSVNIIPFYGSMPYLVLCNSRREPILSLLQHERY